MVVRREYWSVAEWRLSTWKSARLRDRPSWLPSDDFARRKQILSYNEKGKDFWDTRLNLHATDPPFETIVVER